MLAGCGGATPEQDDPAAATSTEPTGTEASSEQPTASPTTTTPEPPTLTADELAGGTLENGEMNLLFRAQGNTRDQPPTSLLQVSSCSSADNFLSYDPVASTIGSYVTEAQDRSYWAYVGHYPGAAADVFAAVVAEVTRCRGSDDEHTVVAPDLEFSPFSVAADQPTEVAPDAPANTTVLGFVGQDGAGYQQALMQEDDFLIVLLVVALDPLTAQTQMADYLAYTLPRFAMLVTEHSGPLIRSSAVAVSRARR